MLRIATRQFCSNVSQRINLLENLVSIRGRDKPTFAIIKQVRELPSAPKIVQEHLHSLPTASTTGDRHLFNTCLANIREMEVEMIERKQSLNISPTGLDYVFYQPDPPLIDKNTPRKVQLYCNAFEETLENKRKQIQEFYFDHAAHLGLIFTSDTFQNDLNEWGIQKAIKGLSHKELYDQPIMLEFALFWWITYGAGRQNFQHYKTQKLNTFCGMKQTKQYPITFTSLPPTSHNIMQQDKNHSNQTGTETDSNVKENRTSGNINKSDSKAFTAENILKNINKETPQKVQPRVITAEAKKQLNEILAGKFTPNPSKRIIIEENVYVVDNDMRSGTGEDAISIGEREGDAQWIQVHISDVAHFVPLNSPLDKFAREFPRTRYLHQARTQMLPNKFSCFLSLNQPQSRSMIETITFSALVDDTGGIIKYKISPTLIPQQNLQKLSFHNFTRHLADGFEDMVILDHYANLLKKRRSSNIKDISNFCVDNKIGAQTTVECPGFHCVRELMLLSGFIAGNIGNQLKLALGFREGLGPIVQTHLESIPTWKPADIIHDSNTGCIESPNPIFFRHYAQVSSPVRKYSDLLNHIQIHSAMISGEKVSSQELQGILTDIKKIESAIMESQNKDYRANDLLKVEKEIGLGGIVVGRIDSIDSDIVSGRNTLMAKIKLINFPKLIVSTKLKKSTKQQFQPGMTLQFRIKELSTKQNFFELELAK